jgi:hypothetical protein
LGGGWTSRLAPAIADATVLPRVGEELLLDSPRQPVDNEISLQDFPELQPLSIEPR